MHHHNFIHRDIALRNFLVSACGTDVVITDFGFSVKATANEVNLHWFKHKKKKHFVFVFFIRRLIDKRKTYHGRGINKKWQTCFFFDWLQEKLYRIKKVVCRVCKKKTHSFFCVVFNTRRCQCVTEN